MQHRRFNSSRLYKLAKVLVIGTTTITGLYGLYALYLIENNIILHQWQDYCSKHPDTKEMLSIGYSCMSTGFQQIDNISGLMYKSLLIAIVLPTLFFGGSFLYKYLFPKTELKTD